MSQPVRLQKYLANAGVTSRRKAEALIVAGRVSINGKVVVELGTRVDPEHDRVALDGHVIVPAGIIWIALHKPAGYLTSRGDPQGRPTIYELLPSTHRGLFYVGRLDLDTEGLVLLTNDGDAAHRLQHPRFRVPRVYDATVAGALDAARIAELLHGVRLDDGPARFLAAQLLRRSGRETQLRVTLAEGRKREVRRVFEAIGHPVTRLLRVRYGPVALGDLAPGAWRPLSAQEISALTL